MKRLPLLVGLIDWSVTNPEIICIHFLMDRHNKIIVLNNDNNSYFYKKTLLIVLLNNLTSFYKIYISGEPIYYTCRIK
jgi:hypothetical protein